MGGVYTLPIFIVCPSYPCSAVYTPRHDILRGVHPSNIHYLPLYPVLKGCAPLAMNLGWVYTLPLFIACPSTPSSGVYTSGDEFLRDVHPCNVHYLPLYALPKGCTPLAMNS